MAWRIFDMQNVGISIFEMQTTGAENSKFGRQSHDTILHNTRVNKIERRLQCTMADNLISIYLQFLNDLQVTLKRQKINSNNKCIE